MKRLTALRAGIVAAALAAPVLPAGAADATLTLNDNEQAALAQLLDAAVRAQGLGVAQNALAIYQKLLAARGAAVSAPAADQPPAAPVTPAKP